MSQEVQRIFTRIYKRYDLMNHLFSFGLDSVWRESAANEAILAKNSYRVLDLGTGTGELAIKIKEKALELGKNVDIHAVDFNRNMLNVAKQKAKRKNLNIEFKMGDALKTNYQNSYFDVVTSSFALRDFDNLYAFISESHRVLKSNGKLVLLEMAMPESFLGRTFFKAYFKLMIFVGSFIGKNAYVFLVESIKEFDKKRLVKLVNDNKFRKTALRNLPSGVAFILTAEK